MSSPRRTQTVALIALFAGALAIASSGIFVRLSETGPTATAFWRGAFSLPVLALWAFLEQRRSQARPFKWDWRFAWAGFFFAGDLALWFWSLLLTSIAASTLEANLAPIVVTLIAWVAWRERPKPLFVAALAVALLGLLLIVGPKFGQGNRALIGDLLGLGTACFYAGYLVAVAKLRAEYGTGIIMLITTAIFTVLLLPMALTQQFFPHSLHGWMLVLGLALITHCLGQGLIAYALASLPATFGSVGLYLQPVAASFYAWLLLGEQLLPIQIAGGAVVLVAIALARKAQVS